MENPESTTSPAAGSRRSFLEVLSIALSGIVAVLAAIPLVGYFFSPVIRRRPDVWVDLGKVDQFVENESEPIPLGRRHRQNSRVRATFARREIPDLRGQLRPSGMSRFLVSRIGPLHVPLSWRGLL